MSKKICNFAKSKIEDFDILFHPKKKGQNIIKTSQKGRQKGL